MDLDGDSWSQHIIFSRLGFLTLLETPLVGRTLSVSLRWSDEQNRARKVPLHHPPFWKLFLLKGSLARNFVFFHQIKKRSFEMIPMIDLVAVLLQALLCITFHLILVASWRRTEEATFTL